MGDCSVGDCSVGDCSVGDCSVGDCSVGDCPVGRLSGGLKSYDRLTTLFPSTTRWQRVVDRQHGAQRSRRLVIHQPGGQQSEVRTRSVTSRSQTNDVGGGGGGIIGAPGGGPCY